MAAASESAIADVIAPVVAAAGADLEQVRLRPAGRRSVLVVVVDADGGVDLDAVAELSRGIGDALDASSVMGAGPYTLEVTSPGVDRPLTLPRHWRRARNRLVKVVFADGETVTGRVMQADDQQATLRLPGGDRVVPYGEVSSAVVQVEFGAKKEN